MLFPILLLLFTVVPAIEIGLFVVIGDKIGPVATIAVVLFTGVAGAALARLQGFAVLQQIQARLGTGQMPTDQLVEAAIVLVGGALLLTPGFLTDVLGLSCLVPLSRKGFATLLRRWASAKLAQPRAAGGDFAGFRVWTGGVRPRADAPGSESSGSSGLFPGYEPPPTGPSPTIDASFSVLEDEDDPTED